MNGSDGILRQSETECVQKDSLIDMEPRESRNPCGRLKVAAKVRTLCLRAWTRGHPIIRRSHASSNEAGGQTLRGTIGSRIGRPAQGLDLNCVDITPQPW